MEVLRVASLTKKYLNGEEEFSVLEQVNFVANKGEFVAVIGSSGSGKSTLLNLLGGLDSPTSGCVYINGVNLCAFTEDEMTEFRRKNIGIVFQNYNLVPVLSVYENIVLPSQLNGDALDESFMGEILDELGIREKLNQMPGKLSGGQQQRVAIARALYTKPMILLADEPTGNLDSKTSEEVIGLIQRVSRKFGQTVIVVTHDERVAQKADRIIRIEDGKIYEEKGNERII